MNIPGALFVASRPSSQPAAAFQSGSPNLLTTLLHRITVLDLLSEIERDRRRHDAQRAAGRRYYARNREKERARRKAFYALNRQDALTYAKKYRQEHFQQASVREKA
jgi:hypothetical protein